MSNSNEVTGFSCDVVTFTGQGGRVSRGGSGRGCLLLHGGESMYRVLQAVLLTCAWNSLFDTVPIFAVL
jgi:hypothetical protein